MLFVKVIQLAEDEEARLPGMIIFKEGTDGASGQFIAEK